jgi:signal transduction histidine kinase
MGQTQLTLRRLRRDGCLEPERDGRALRAVAAQAANMARLVNRLLDVSHLESGVLRLQRRPVDLAPLVARAVTDARATSDRHDITLTAPTSLHAAVDPTRLEHAFAALLDNAMRSSPDGGAIDVTLSQSTSEAAALTVECRACGGSPDANASDVDRIPAPRSDGARGGTGLGLRFSREIVALHGGELQVELPPSGGARVVVRLPLALDPGPAATGSGQSPSE